jgi:hypothetical protein
LSVRPPYPPDPENSDFERPGRLNQGGPVVFQVASRSARGNDRARL